MITPQEQLDIIISKVKQFLLSKGQFTIRTLGKTFRSFESFDQNQKLDKDEFLIGLKENGVQLTKYQTDFLLSYLDKNRDGSIDVSEFLQFIRGTPNQERQTIIDQSYRKFDPDFRGYVVIDDLKGIYNALDHPKVVRGELALDQAFVEFLQSFKEGNRKGIISYDEWREYYAAVSADIEKDQYFVALMMQTWRLS